MERQVWRVVGGHTIMCTDCPKNKVQLGGDDICTAEDEICIFLKQKLDRQKTWGDFHEAYHEMNQEEQE